MTTLIFIENVLGSGQMVKLTEDFGDYSVTRDLKPGENARLVVSPFKSVSVEEIPLGVIAAAANEAAHVAGFPGPLLLERRSGTTNLFRAAPSPPPAAASSVIEAA